MVKDKKRREKTGQEVHRVQEEVSFFVPRSSFTPSLSSSPFPPLRRPFSLERTFETYDPCLMSRMGIERKVYYTTLHVLMVFYNKKNFVHLNSST